MFLQLASDVVDRDHVDEGVVTKKLLCLPLLEVSDEASNHKLYGLQDTGRKWLYILKYLLHHFLLQPVGQADQIDEKRVVRVDRG